MQFPKLVVFAAATSCLIATGSAHAQEQHDAFHPGAPTWTDTDGNHIIAHGGGILEHEGVFYWYGEQRWGENARPAVRCYSSTDLYNWNDEGLVLTDEDVFENSIFERPKVIYNETTKKFVLWWHQELPGIGYDAARTAVATSDTPTGKFTFHRSFRPNVGRIPINGPIDDIKDLDQWKAAVDAIDEEDWPARSTAGEALLRDIHVGQMARDMTLYKDDDGTAYLIYSSEENSTLQVAELDDTYTDFTGTYSRVLPGGQNEAPAVFKSGGKYYMIASGLTGWAPNPARSHVADNLLGPWTPLGSPMRGDTNPHTGKGPGLTFGGQSTHILPNPKNPEQFIAMFDVWTPSDLNASPYIWLPITFEAGKPVIYWQDEWTLDDGWRRAEP